MRSGKPACWVPSRLRGGKFLGPSSQSFSLRSQSAPRIGDRKAERKKAASWHLLKASGRCAGSLAGAATEVGEVESSRVAIIAGLNGWAGRR